MNIDGEFKIEEILDFRTYRISPPIEMGGDHKFRASKVISLEALPPNKLESDSQFINKLNRQLVGKIVKIEDVSLIFDGFAYARLNTPKAVGQSTPTMQEISNKCSVLRYRESALASQTSLPPVENGGLFREVSPSHHIFWGDVALPDEEGPQNNANILFNTLYSDTHKNKADIDLKFHRFIKGGGSTCMILMGNPGIGKSWWLRRQLLNLKNKKAYHTAIVSITDRPPHDLSQDLHSKLRHQITNQLGYDEIIRVHIKHTHKIDESDSIFEEVRRQKHIEYASSQNGWTFLNDISYYYGADDTPELVIAVDNTDHLSAKEFEEVYKALNGLFGGKKGVKLIFTCRPMSTHITGFVSEPANKNTIDINMRSPSVEDMLFRRFSTSATTEKLDLERTFARGESYQNILDDYLGSYKADQNSELQTASFIHGLSSYDKMGQNNAQKTDDFNARHYLKLFRQFIRSPALILSRDVTSIYKAICALMLDEHGANKDGFSGILNFFDHSQVTGFGRSTIRFRLLETIMRCEAFGDRQKFFMRAMGYLEQDIEQLFELFYGAGLVRRDLVDTKKIVLTNIGSTYFSLLQNKHYLICCKTGVRVPMEYLKFGDDVSNNDFFLPMGRKIRAHYSNKGWLSDRNFVSFIRQQEIQEIHNFGKSIRSSETPEVRRDTNFHHYLKHDAIEDFTKSRSAAFIIHQTFTKYLSAQGFDYV